MNYKRKKPRCKNILKLKRFGYMVCSCYYCWGSKLEIPEPFSDYRRRIAEEIPTLPEINNNQLNQSFIGH